jgi:molybdate transport system substrate-binding protein
MPPSLRRTLAACLLASAAALTSGCGSKATPAPSARLQVQAAASLADAFREIGAAFETANPGTKVEFSFAGSNQLRTQLENGGPGDVFASADRKQMDSAAASKVIDASTVRIFASNRLALIVPKESRAGLRQFADLARPGLKIVVADKAVPAGNYTRQMLDKAGADPALGPAFVKAFDANTVSREENVAAVVAKVALNEADAGIAYACEAAGSQQSKLVLLALPSALEQQADYPAAVTSRATDPKLAARFLDFLKSAEATAILVKRGFSTPENQKVGGVSGNAAP